MIKHPYEAWLDKVQKPSQYVGGELNAVVKDAAKVDCRLLLCFPELYSIGMSNLGLKILYSVVNARENLWAERCFAPEPDMEAELKERNEPLRSLESHDALSEFDIVGFSISTELCFSEILAMLALGGIPLKSADRDEKHPLVVGGGPSVFNPEPIADFFDIFVLGEAEEVLPKICEVTGKCRENGTAKQELLKELAAIDGVYVPVFFDFVYDGVQVKEIVPLTEHKPKRVYLEDLNSAPYPYDMVIPFGQPVFDRLSVEVDRGCTGGCRFCQAGTTYRPVRERSPDEVMKVAERGLASTGFDNLSLASLSTGDYSQIEPLVKRLMDECEKKHIALSLPSLRSGTLTEGMIADIGRVRKTGFTITAEAGSERLRNVINKKISDDDIVNTARSVLAGGWKVLKLYFMIGLPTETEEDLQKLIDLVMRIDDLCEDGKRFRQINVGVSQFVPKPHTAFQWVAMDSFEELLRKKMFIKHALHRRRTLSMKGHDVEMSFLEGAFARGDRRLSAVIEAAYHRGCRLDGWGDYFRYEDWIAAFADAGFRAEDYANRERELDEVLPWDHLDVGLTKKYFLRELKSANKEEATTDCRYDKCHACGLNPYEKLLADPFAKAEENSKDEKEKGRFKYRLFFEKLGVSRYLSHLEFKAGFTRAVRRAELGIAYSQGMHPHPKLSFGPALSVGIESLQEAIDIELEEFIEPLEIQNRLNKTLETGLKIISAAELHPPLSSIQAETVSSRWEVSVEPSADFGIDEIKHFLEQSGKVTMIADESERLIVDTAGTSPLGLLRRGMEGFFLGDKIKIKKLSMVMENPKLKK